MSLPSNVYSNVTAAQVQSLQVQISNMIGAPVSGNAGTVSQQGFTIAWKYDPAALSLQVSVLQKPWWCPDSTIQDKLNSLMQMAAADHSQVKLGRKAVVKDSRTLKLARYLASDIPAPPAVADWKKGITDWGMMLNDQLGCCTIAGRGHAIQVWSANLGTELTVSDDDILAAYERDCGYVKGDPSTDQGGIEINVLTDWKNEGFAGHNLLGFAAVNVDDPVELRQAIYMFGGIYTGLQLPLSAQNQAVWDAVDGEEGEPGSWGGHCTFWPAYTQDTYDCLTWGGVKTMTEAFRKKYMDEAYVLLGADWLNAAGSPAGFAMDILQQDLAKIH